MEYFVSNDDHRGASQTSYFGSGGHGTCSVGLERLLEVGLFGLKIPKSEGNSVARFWLPNPPKGVKFPVGILLIVHEDPGDLSDTTVPYWGP